MIDPAHAVVYALGVCVLGAGAALLTARNRRLAGWLSFAATAISSVLVLLAAGRVLIIGPGESTPFLEVSKLGFALRVHVDGLSAVFLCLIATIALPASFFSIEYMDGYPQYGVGRYYPNLMLFIAAMYGLVSTSDMMWFFFIFWQMMTLPGYALIRFEKDNPACRRASNKYLVMMQIACLLTMIGAELLASSPAGAKDQALRYDFDSIARNLPLLLRSKSGVVTAAFALFLAGFGIKLGMWPFGQVWLPDAHPAAPSPVSALLSGVMIKTGVYGLMRYFLWLVPAEAQGDYPIGKWGLVMAILGTVTLFTGTMQALKQDQSKRLLAFHSIGQVGYILLGLGTCLALLPSSDWALVSLACIGFLGALLHTLNHALFKSLLFLNSGSMLWATGTQDLNSLGGLMRFMPLTGATTLVASLSIAGAPLFNGFVSKWCVYVAAIQGGEVAPYLPLCGLIAILTSVLTLASFIKFFGAAFLSRSSKLVTMKGIGLRSLEPGLIMQGPQVFLAVLCVGIGLMPAAVFQIMDAALATSRQGLGIMLSNAKPALLDTSMGVTLLGGKALFVPVAVAVSVVLFGMLAAWLTRAGGAARRSAAPWLCGYEEAAERHRYAARNYYIELKRHFKWLGGAPRAAQDATDEAKEH